MSFDHAVFEDETFAARLIQITAIQVIQKARIPAHEIGDIERELLLDLLQRLPRFDPSRSSLKTFASIVVKHSAARILETRGAKKRWKLAPLESLDEIADHIEVEPLEDGERLERGRDSRNHSLILMTDLPAEQIGLKIDVERAIATLPPDLAEICRQLMVSTVAEVARNKSRSRRGLYHVVAKLRSHFDKAGLREYLR